jgi:SAM-dependent methyltransferase
VRAPISYDTIAPSYARHRGALDFVVHVLEGLHARAPARPFLEVGCGTGAYATALAVSTSCHGFGIDASRQMLKQAPAHRRTTYVQGHAARLPFSERSLGMIFSVNVVHHIADIEGYLRETFTALAPGGVLCTATDSEAMIRRRDPLSRYWPSTVRLELARYHSIEMLREVMAHTGFRSIEVCDGRSDFSISEIGPYRDRAYSCLQLISERDFNRGLRAMQTDLRAGPLKGTSELAFLTGMRP